LLCGVEGVAEGSRPKYDAAEMDPNDREGSMKRVSSIAAVALLPLALASSVNAANERSLFALRSFIGLWESIGALHSITCSSDRTCELVGSVLRGTACRGESASVAGTGHLEGDELVFLTAPRPGGQSRSEVSSTRSTTSGGSTLPSATVAETKGSGTVRFRADLATRSEQKRRQNRGAGSSH
jgi:hypothetical protein